MAVKAKVIDHKKDYLLVETIAGATREGCTSCGKGRGNMRIFAQSDVEYEKGALVDIDIPSGSLNLASFYIYGLPLLLIIAGIALGVFGFSKTSLAPHAELLGFLVGVVIGVIYYVIIFRRQYSIAKDGKFMAKVVGRSTPNTCQLELKHHQEEQ